MPVLHFESLWPSGLSRRSARPSTESGRPCCGHRTRRDPPCPPPPPAPLLQNRVLGTDWFQEAGQSGLPALQEPPEGGAAPAAPAPPTWPCPSGRSGPPPGRSGRAARASRLPPTPHSSLARAGGHWPQSRAPPQERTAEPRGQTASRFGRLRPECLTGSPTTPTPAPKTR